MRRVPVWLVILLCIAVVAGVWIAGTQPYDFLTPPDGKTIALARSRATQELARPSDLFALPPVLPEAEPEEAPEPEEPPPPPPPPEIPLTDLPEPLPANFWANGSEFPAASFLNAGARLESESRPLAALTAYERVLDHTTASEEEIQAALRGLRLSRSKLAIPGESESSAPKVKLKIRTPSRWVNTTRKAARLAAETLAQASFRQLKFEAWITPDRRKADHLTLALERPEEAEPASADIPVSADVEELRNQMLSAAFRIVASSLALDSSLAPISQPPEGEPAEDSLSSRITRRAWSHFVPQATDAENP
ncbi:hypothetical protein [Haloferula sargassicola]|uniref:Uncharacterized protein n=1 Tax=Haloferula sargassicola TaxID=490096 RepID=A0ABP9UTS1_9BACT